MNMNAMIALTEHLADQIKMTAIWFTLFNDKLTKLMWKPDDNTYKTFSRSMLCDCDLVYLV